MQYLARLARRIRIRLRRVAEAVKAWWCRHRDRISEESDYAEAFAAVLLAAVALFTDSHAIKYLARELIGAYVAVLRVLSPRLRWDYS